MDSYCLCRVPGVQDERLREGALDSRAAEAAAGVFEDRDRVGEGFVEVDCNKDVELRRGVPHSREDEGFWASTGIKLACYSRGGKAVHVGAVKSSCWVRI